jgi:DNA-directed RNA polymerase subunit RPC12/RpoP
MTRPKCADCGRELTDQDVEDGAEICYACWHWYMDYAGLEEAGEDLAW